MKTVYRAVAVVWLVSLFAGQVVWNTRHSSAFAATSAEITARSASAAEKVTDALPGESDDVTGSRVDLFGNEVEDALADYRFDLTGDVYEQHSPETAVPKLASPSS
jgi:hypothetical protein